MLTKIDLCSMALLKLGEAPIQSLEEDTVAAQLSRTLFDPVIDALLAMHVWRFACRRFTLTKNDDGDFLIPVDCLRIIDSGGHIRGDRIGAPGDTMTIVGLGRVGPESFPGYFASLAATRLAMEVCIPLSGQQTVFRMLAALYETELQSAKFIDSTTSEPDAIKGFSLISTRF